MTSNPPLPDEARAALAALASPHAPAQGSSATTDAAAQSAKPTAKATLSSAASDPLPTAVEAPSTPSDESVREARAVAEAAVAELIAEKDQEIVELAATHSNTPSGTTSGTTSDAAIAQTKPSEAQGGAAAAAVTASSTTPASSVSRANRMYMALAEEDGDTADLAAGLGVARSPRTASSHTASSHVVHRVWSPPHSPNHDRDIKAAPELLHPVGSVANSRKLFERCVCALPPPPPPSLRHTTTTITTTFTYACVQPWTHSLQCLNVQIRTHVCSLVHTNTNNTSFFGCCSLVHTNTNNTSFFGCCSLVHTNTNNTSFFGCQQQELWG
jgi:hypothetical protein